MKLLSEYLTRLARKDAGYKNARNRRPPKFRVLPTTDDAPARVYYLCPDSDSPSGGVRNIYRSVDLLNSIGMEAAVVHHRRGFVCTWFKHQTKVIAASKVDLTSLDTLVIPEFYGSYLNDIPMGPRLIVFNQNAYSTFSGPQAVASWKRCMDSGKLEAMIVVSLDSEEYIKYAFPEVRVERVRNAVNSQVFYPAAGLPRRRLAFMPRRREKDCAQVLDLLAMRGALDDWEVVVISKRSEEETADILRSSAIFLSFSEQEGFGMPPAEAMACGCYVVGFTGLGGREYFYPGLCSPVEEGNVLAFAKAVKDAMENFDSDAYAMRQLALAASSRVRDEYSVKMQLCELRDIFESR